MICSWFIKAFMMPVCADHERTTQPNFPSMTTTSPILRATLSCEQPLWAGVSRKRVGRGVGHDPWSDEQIIHLPMCRLHTVWVQLVSSTSSPTVHINMIARKCSRSIVHERGGKIPLPPQFLHGSCSLCFFSKPAGVKIFNEEDGYRILFTR